MLRWTPLFLAAQLACASAPPPAADWQKDNAAPGAFETDRYDCMKEAETLTQGWWCAGLECLLYPTPYTKYFAACMEARGWRRR